MYPACVQWTVTPGTHVPPAVTHSHGVPGWIVNGIRQIPYCVLHTRISGPG
jgi:hypothetical protein